MVDLDVQVTLTGYMVAQNINVKLLYEENEKASNTVLPGFAVKSSLLRIRKNSVWSFK